MRHVKGQQLWNRSEPEAKCPHPKQPSAHTVLASKREGNIIQSLNTFLFTTAGIQLGFLDPARKQDQMTETPKSKKVKADQ